MRRIFQLLAVLGSAAFAGVLLAIGLIVGGIWKTMPAADFLTAFADHGRFIMHTIPLVLLPAVLGIFGSLWIARHNGRARRMWLGAAACIAGILAVTAVYFMGANAAFAAGEMPVADVPARIDTWLDMHAIRIVLAAAAALFAGVAVTKTEGTIDA